MHGCQDRSTEDNGQERNDDCQKNGQIYGIHHKRAHLCIFFCAKLLCDRNDDAAAGTKTKTDDQKRDRRG